MDVEHMMVKEACITRIKMKRLKEQSSNSLQKLNPYYILFSTIYSLFTMLLSSLEGLESYSAQYALFN